MLSLRGKTAMVTGAAGGIGRSTAAALAGAGADVALMDIPAKTELLNGCAQYIADKFGVKTMVVTGDVSCEASVRALYQQIVENFGTIDVVHSNAEIAMPQDNIEMSLDVWQRMLDINYTGMLLVAREAAEIMRRHHHSGSIILTASMSAHIINRRQPNDCYSIGYTSTKAAVKQMGRALAMEYVKDGIRVNSISPGYVLSGLHDKTDADKLAFMASGIPMQRFGTLNEIMGAVVCLASDLSSYHIGSDILINGGYCTW